MSDGRDELEEVMKKMVDERIESLVSAVTTKTNCFNHHASRHWPTIVYPDYTFYPACRPSLSQLGLMAQEKELAGYINRSLAASGMGCIFGLQRLAFCRTMVCNTTNSIAELMACIALLLLEERDLVWMCELVESLV